jgi:hypothetical protein
MVHHESIAAQLCRDPPISVAPVGKRHALHCIAQRRLLLAWRRRRPLPVVTGAVDLRQRAHSLDRKLALRAW